MKEELFAAARKRRMLRELTPDPAAFDDILRAPFLCNCPEFAQYGPHYHYNTNAGGPLLTTGTRPERYQSDAADALRYALRYALQAEWHQPWYKRLWQWLRGLV